MATAFRQLDWNDLRWCLLRAPQAVLQLMKKHPENLICAGGFIRSCIANEPINDIDLMAVSPELAKAYAQEFAGGDKFHTTDNTYSVTKDQKYMVQFIHRWAYPCVEDLLSSLDFTICQAAFWWNGNNWTSCCTERFYPDLAARRLVYTAPKRVEEPGGSLLRVLKFYQRGYRIPLDSFGAVIARLIMGVERDGFSTEGHLGNILTGLLREVDPMIDPTHIAHLPVLTNDDAGLVDPLEQREEGA